MQRLDFVFLLLQQYDYIQNTKRTNVRTTHTTIHKYGEIVLFNKNRRQRFSLLSNDNALLTTDRPIDRPTICLWLMILPLLLAAPLCFKAFQFCFFFVFKLWRVFFCFVYFNIFWLMSENQLDNTVVWKYNPEKVVAMSSMNVDALV